MYYNEHVDIINNNIIKYAAIHFQPSTYIHTTPATSGSVSLQLQPTSLPGPGVKEDDCVCSENYNSLLSPMRRANHTIIGGTSA